MFKTYTHVYFTLKMTAFYKVQIHLVQYEPILFQVQIPSFTEKQLKPA